MTNSHEDTIEARFAKLLYNYMRQVEDERHQRLSVSWFARHFGVKQASLSNYLAGNTIPGDDNVAKIAERVGPIVYDILERPRPIPDSPLLRFVALSWDRLTPEQQERIVRIIEEPDLINTNHNHSPDPDLSKT